MRTLTLTASVTREVPDEATDYKLFSGTVLFFKCNQVGVVGDHWYYLRHDGVWHFHGHNRPQALNAIPEDGIISVDPWVLTEGDDE